MIEVLLGICLILLIVLIFIVLRSKRLEPVDVKNAVSNMLVETGLGEKITRIEIYARDIKESYKSFEQMLRVPKERASLGELALENILSDQLPPDMYGIRESVLNGRRPDAYIKSTAGMICVDSKFALDNYGNMLKADNTAEKQKYRKDFISDVKRCLDKVAHDYICPNEGSAEFAFAYIPSESVYFFLVSEAYEMLRSYAKIGIQVVSPLTLSHKIELIRTGINAKKLSEKAEEVRNGLIGLSYRFNEVDDKWRVFYESHFRNAEAKATELNIVYKNLRDEFDRISKMPED